MAMYACMVAHYFWVPLIASRAIHRGGGAAGAVAPPPEKIKLPIFILL